MNIFKARDITELRFCGTQESDQRIIELTCGWSFKTALRITWRALAISFAPLPAMHSAHIALYVFLSSEQWAVKLKTFSFRL